MAERESSLEQRERKDKEKAEYIKARQIRLGHVEEEKKRGHNKAKKSESEPEPKSE